MGHLHFVSENLKFLSIRDEFSTIGNSLFPHMWISLLYLRVFLLFVSTSEVSSKVRMSSHPANPLLGMMSSYHSDEDDDDDEEGKTEPKDDPQIEEDEEESKEEKKEPVKKRTQIDEQVADFLKVSSAQ